MMNKMSFLDTIEKVYKVASEKIDKQLEEDVQEIISKLSDYFIKILDLKNEKPEKYKSLLVRTRYTEKKNPQNVPFLLHEYYEPSHEGIQVYCNVFFKIWKKSFDNELENTVYFTVSKIVDILQDSLKRGKDYMTVSNYFIGLLQNINLEMSKTPNRFSNSTARASYNWFFEIVFADDFKLELLSDLQIALFISIRISLANDNEKVFHSFIAHIISGSYYPTYGMLPDIDSNTKYSNKEIFKEYEKAKDNLFLLSRQSLTFQDYQNVIVAFEVFKSAINKYTSVEEETRQKILIEYKRFIEQQFKYNILQQTVIWLGSYCLYIKKYKYIDFLLNYNQPKDSSAFWVNQDINPLNTEEILTLFYRRHDLERNITFLWEGHHDFLSYYDTFIAILLINAINLNKRKGESWRSEYKPNLKNSEKTVQEIDSLGYSLDNLLNIVNFLKNDKTIIEACGLTESMASAANTLLENIKSNIGRQKQEIEMEAKVDEGIASNFIDIVVETYSKTASVRNIINYYNPISSKILKYPKGKYLSFGINEIMTKGLFSNKDKGLYVGFPEGVARRFIFDENMTLRRIISESCTKTEMKTDQSMVVQLLDNLDMNEPLNDKVLIFSNLNPSYEIFSSRSDFIPVEKITDKKPNMHEFVGRYKGADVFTLYDETRWKNLLALKILPKYGIGTIKYFAPSRKEDFNIKERFYWKIHNLNDRQEIIDDLLKQQPYWLLQQASDLSSQREYLQKQVNIIILYKMNFVLPKGFRGWTFSL